MRIRWILGVVALLFATNASAQVGQVTSTPSGWYELCQREAVKCQRVVGIMPRLSHETWMKMIRINREVNAFIIPTSDLEHWGVLEHWDIPTPKDPHGDCEDYVLLKRQRFIDELGWSTDALLITVVRETNGEWHAVLVVRTQGGDYVLDNLSDSIVPSYVTSYRYFKRQSDHDPNVWVVFGDGPPTDLAAFNKKNKK